MAIKAAADGSALGNPGPAGWAWYVDDACWHAGGWPRSTNNRGEIMAVVDLLESTAHRAESLRILCDSKYVINAATAWLPGWKRKGWRKADGSPVVNRDLLQRLDAALAGRDVAFEWVKGHAGHTLNEAADDRARAAALAFQEGAPVPTGPGFPQARTATPNSPATALKPSAAPTLFDEADTLEPSAGPLSAGAVPDDLIRRERELARAMASDRSAVSALLHPDFVEIGASGVLHTRSDVLRFVAGRDRASADTIEPVSVEDLGNDLALLVYRAGATLRSSLWQRCDGRWLVRFHQGTPTG